MKKRFLLPIFGFCIGLGVPLAMGQTLTAKAETFFVGNVGESYSFAPQETVLTTRGDIDGDGEVSGSDLSYLRRYLVGREDNNSAFDETSADVNADSRIDGLDVMLLRQYLAGWEVELADICVHEYITYPAQQATCTQVGWKAYQECQLCGKTDYEEEPLLPHSFSEENVCTVCGYTVVYSYHSTFAYDSLLDFTNGEKMQNLYRDAALLCESFHCGTTDAEYRNFGGNTLPSLGVDYGKYGLTLTEAETVWSAVRCDHPLYYWLTRNYGWGESSFFFIVADSYAESEVRGKTNERIEREVKRYLDLAQGQTDDFETALLFRNTILDKVEYAWESDGVTPSDSLEAHSILGVFDGEEVVCEGYARAFQLLLNVREIENVFVVGQANGGSHAWNYALLDEAWYAIDLTWDDGREYEYASRRYDYFAATKEEIEQEHHAAECGVIGINYQAILPELTNTPHAKMQAIGSKSIIEIGDMSYEYLILNPADAVLTRVYGSGKAVIPESVRINERDYRVVAIAELNLSITQDSHIFGDSVTEVTIPQTVKRINFGAFYCCPSLTAVYFADAEGWWKTNSTSLDPAEGTPGMVGGIDASVLQDPARAATFLKENYLILNQDD